MVFDTHRFLREKWPTVAHLVRFTSGYGVVLPTDDALFRWYRRDSIPSAWLPILLALLELEAGAPVSLTEYLTK
jgi:hypothetical protein